MESHPEATSQGNTAKKSPLDDLSRDELVVKCKALLSIAQKAKQAKAELQNEVESYKLQLDKCETEKKVNLESLQTLQELVDSLTEQKLNYITEVDSAKGKIKALNEKCNHFVEEINKYKAESFVKDKNVIDITQKLSDLDSEIISLKRQNNRLTEENEQLINQLSELEAQTLEFNNIGLEQRKQLQMLEEKVQAEHNSNMQFETLKNRIEELENELKRTANSNDNKEEYENKIKEITQLYELEKNKKEKANIKLRSYKDKILKCAACITQLKNSRFILQKTIREYSENIPKWQTDIIKASKIFDEQMKELSSENCILKEKLQNLEKLLLNEKNDTQVADLNIENSSLKEKVSSLEQSNKSLREALEEYKSQISSLNSECTLFQSQLSDLQKQLSSALDDKLKLTSNLDSLQLKYQDINDVSLPTLIEENRKLTLQLGEMKQNHDVLNQKSKELSSLCDEMKSENQKLSKSISKSGNNSELIANLNLQIKALESEKSMLVKEKLNARDNVVELENRNKILSDQVEQLKSDLQSTQSQLDALCQKKNVLERNLKSERDAEVNSLKSKIMHLQEQNDLLKKEHDNLQDLNGLLKEEVETLKFSLEQPRSDDTDNLSDLNVSLQTDIVKLETKLSAYKQENASLLAEVKESRAKVKEFDSISAEYEDAKSKLSGYKTENTELLNEMKEINQVLKERGEAISKLQKAIAEMERLVETLEKDRNIVNQEKDELQKKVIALENDLKNAEQNTNKKNEVADQMINDKETALKALAEKDTVISSLKEEVEKLKQQQSSSAELPNEDMSTSTISKAEEHSRMKDLDETFEEKYTKLRIFALKLKKKLNETVNQLQSTEQDKLKLEKLLEGDKSVVTTSSDEIDGCKASEISDLQAKIKTLNGALENSEKNIVELEKLRADVENKSQKLAAVIEAHKVTKENLEKARRDAKKKNVLSLEMEDYERSMKELTTKMEEKKKKMVQMESTIDTQEGTITAMRTQIKLLEEQIRTEETQNRLTKEELQHAIEEGSEKENIIQIKNNVISKLEQDLEEEKRKNEESDLEMTSMMSEKEKVIMNLGEEKAELNNKVKRLEFKCAELNEKLRITNIELADLKTEYTSYKVRAQAVLRQNQTVDHSQEEQLKEEAAALKAQVEALTAKLTTAQDQCSELSGEVEASRRRAAEASGEAARAHQRTARLQADLTRLSHQLDSERTQHNLQISTLTQCYKTQISELEMKLQKETDVLKKQVLAAQENAKVAVGPLRLDEANHNQYMLPVIPKEEGSDGEMDINVSMIPREEGEGSESAPSPPPSKPYLTSAGSGRSPVPLERLLEEGVPDDEALDTTSLALTPEQEIADLRRRMLAQQQRVKHVTVLLSESERECARMSQLSELLKAELRRLQGSTHAAHNAEYMKNVTLKFLTLPPGDERSRLVPVLQKILALTPDEANKIHAVARGMDPNPSKGWGSYLPWPGGGK